MHPAELRIENISKRRLTVKVMKSSGKKYTVVHIKGGSSGTVNIRRTGRYYLKVKAALSGRRPVFKKWDSFYVYVGGDEYSILTVEFNIQEDALSASMSGKEISESAFERDSD